MRRRLSLKGARFDCNCTRRGSADALNLARAARFCYDRSSFCPASNDKRPRRLARPRTSPFHGGNAGSNPAGDASFQTLTHLDHEQTTIEREPERPPITEK